MTRPVARIGNRNIAAAVFAASIAILLAGNAVAADPPPVSDPAAVSEPAAVSISTADGRSLDALLVEISDAGVRFESAGKVADLPFDELSHIRIDRPVSSPLPMRVQLAGGSQVSVSGIEWTDQTVTITPARQSPLSVPVQQLRWVRFRAGNSATNPAWLGWLEESRRGDRLVVRRNEKALDSIEGTALGISRDSVEFETRGNRIAAPLAKLEGVLLSNQTGDPGPAAIRVSDTAGSQWTVDSIRLAPGGQQLRISLGGATEPGSAIEHEIPLEQIREIRFAGGILPLAEAEIAASDFGRKSAGITGLPLAAEFDTWFSPKTAEGVVRMHAPGTITFRIPDGYQRFIVASRRSGEVSQFTAVRLEVLLDGDVKWTAVTQDRESLGLELPLAGARQLTLRAAAVSAEGDAAPVASLGGTIEWFSGRLLK